MDTVGHEAAVNTRHVVCGFMGSMCGRLSIRVSIPPSPVLNGIGSGIIPDRETQECTDLDGGALLNE